MTIPSKVQFALACLVYGILAEAAAFGYPVAPSLSLEKLVEEADLIVKATAISSQPVKDAWFGEVKGFAPLATRLKVISVLKGDEPRKEVTFRHLAANDGAGFRYMPQHYKIEIGQTYIIFAKRAGKQGVYRQLWKNHRSMEDQGLLRAADKSPHAGKLVREVIWDELTSLLDSPADDDVKYAVAKLDHMSGGSYDELKDFDRQRVLEAIQSLITHETPEIARVAILTLGSRNPYLSPDAAPGWLGTIGGAGPLPGIGKWDLKQTYLGSQLFWIELADVANSEAPASVRALAIRALGRAKRPELLELAEDWIHDHEPAVRQAAVVLLADYPDQVNHDLLKQMSGDESASVRVGVAHAIGFGQFVELVPLLERLVQDPEPRVSTAAAMCLVSFALKHSHEALTVNIEHPQFRSVFVNALARKDPEPYLEALGDIVKNDLMPQNWWGGHVPWGVSWNLLFKYAQSQPVAKLRRGDLDDVFDALESPISGHPQSPQYYSSSEPRDLYALYVQRGLSDRAKEFRAACQKNITYDIDYYFKMVDKNPPVYQRN